jgi:hypothetical protein
VADVAILANAAIAALVVAAFDPRRNQWTTLPSPGAASQIVSAAGRVFAWTNGSSRGAVLDPRTRRWLPLPALPHGARSESFVAAFDGRLAVVGLRQDPGTSGPDHATVDVFDPRTQAWRPFESGSVGPPLAGSEVAGARGALVWSSAGSLGSFSSRSSAASVPGAEFSELGGAPVPLDRTGASLVAIGDRRFFLWGGRLAGNEHDQTNYPTRDGVIVRLP